MGEKMTPIPFKKLINRILCEYENEKTVFGVRYPYIKKDNKTLELFGEKAETPFGPAAGPNTQLAQNIVAAYFAGSRFFELKTVQIIDGEELAACISRPCILAEDEGYNCEWSTELLVSQACDEYIKAWLALKVFSKKFGLGSPDGFIFNMSVGYDLEGIKSDKIDRFIESLKDASVTPQWKEYKNILKEIFPKDAEYIDNIPSRVCTSVTLSTLHGCPPQEIERIASYLIAEKHLNTFVKCNPTILGYDFARETLDKMGYDYISFDDRHFREDLQYCDAVPMFTRLKALAESKGSEFGLKLSNTFPVDVKAGELPSEEMYMSGKSLFPLTVEMANRISKQFNGKMRISYSGGADFFNIDKLFEAGIWPITVATTILKPGGYNRLKQLAEKLERCEFRPFDGVDCEKTDKLAKEAVSDIHYIKPVKPLPNRKINKSVPLTDCFIAPCKSGCPIGQDIPEYIELCGQKKYTEALKVITAKNPLPFITGTICPHHCADKCTRNFYEIPVDIRSEKLKAAENGFDEFIKNFSVPKPSAKTNVAIVGGGPAGMAAAYFLGISGIKATVYEKEAKLGGIVRNVIPSFRISDEAIDKDIELIKKSGTEIKLNTEAPSIKKLKSMGYTHILYCTGAVKPGKLDIGGNTLNVIDFLKRLKSGENINIGKNVAVIGGGNTAMDAARAAKRVCGVENVTIVYRRTKKYMPADEEELAMAVGEGVEFLELAAHVKHENGVLTARKMILGKPDESGRRSPVETDELINIKADTVIAAVGESVDSEFFTSHGIEVDKKGRPSFKTNINNVYVAGDALKGPSTVVECIADAKAFCEAITENQISANITENMLSSEENAVSKKGVLKTPSGCESERCLSCNIVCENCVDVCPNRANIVIHPNGMGAQIVHIDSLCNECGNCETFCPYNSAPYKDKFTLFSTVEEFSESTNNGFVPLGENLFRVRLDNTVNDYDLSKDNNLDKNIEILILTIKNDYPYIL